MKCLTAPPPSQETRILHISASSRPTTSDAAIGDATAFASLFKSSSDSGHFLVCCNDGTDHNQMFIYCGIATDGENCIFCM